MALMALLQFIMAVIWSSTSDPDAATWAWLHIGVGVILLLLDLIWGDD